MTLEVHVTELRGFKHCRREWFYTNVLNLRKRDEGLGATWLGSAMHFALARYYSKGENPLAPFDERVVGDAPLAAVDRNWFEQQVELGRTMLTGYLPYAQRSDDFEVVDVERTFSARLPDTHIWLVGTVDLLVRKPSGSLYVLDHKTFTNFSSEGDIESDDQLMLYIWLVSQNYPGQNVDGAIYNMLRKKIPAKPYELKGGGLSKAKGIDTTYDVYLGEIERLGLDPNDYADVLASLRGNDFYRRLVIRRSPAVAEQFAREAATAASEMPHAAIYPNRGDYCKWGCRFASVCRAESLCGDYQSIIDAEFTSEAQEIVRK